MTSWWDAAKERRRQRSDKKEEASGSSAQEPPAENRGIFEDVEVARPESKKKKHDQVSPRSNLILLVSLTSFARSAHSRIRTVRDLTSQAQPPISPNSWSAHRRGYTSDAIFSESSGQMASTLIDQSSRQGSHGKGHAAGQARHLYVPFPSRRMARTKADPLSARAWINKAPSGPTRPDFKGRGRMGIIKQRNSRILFTLVEGKTPSEIQDIKFIKRADKLARSAGVVREDMKLRRKVISDWAW